MLGDWAAVLVFAVIAMAIPLSLLFATFALDTRSKRRAGDKRIPFESGVSANEFHAHRFTISYYLTAMLFIVFDIEIVFLYPLAVQLRELALFGFMELLVFVALLGIGYVYIWRKGALEWK